MNVAGYAVFFDRLGGPDAVRAALDQRSGGYLDPGLVADFRARAPELLAEGTAGDVSDRLLAAEPRPYQLVIGPDDREEVLRVFGDLVDLKTPFLHGHSAGVSGLADGACRRLGLDDETVTLARHAALVQDIGRAAVPTSIWEHPGPLGSDAWRLVRLHAYHSEQILCGSAALAAIGRLAGRHHERLDGSGYHRGSEGAQLGAAARVLAAADAYRALVSERPHRPAFTPERARAELAAQVRSSKLDGDAVAAVVGAASGDGHPPRRVRPAGLTERQLEVLRLVARGMSNREIGASLVISPRTAERHVEDVYQRIGVSSRAAAAMFAMERGLL